jgi:hypothetical protein
MGDRVRWAVLSSVLFSSVSYAQQPAPPPAPAPTPAPAPGEDPALLEKAKVHFQQGVALYNDGNFSAALAEFLEAYRLKKSSGVLYNIGLTQKALFRYGEAIDSLSHYLTESTSLTPERKAEVEQLINEMKALLAPFVVTGPTGAQVSVDGRALGAIEADKPMMLQLAAGAHVVEVTADGYKPMKRDVQVTAGIAGSAAFNLEKIPTTGKAHITASQPMATVTVDGKAIGFAPLDVELGAGGHQLEVTKEKFLPSRQELVISAGQAREVSVVLEKPVSKTPAYKQWWPWTILGVVVAGTAVGLGVGLTQKPTPLSGTLQPGVGNVN